MKKLIISAAILALALSAGSCQRQTGERPNAENIKVGFIYVGSIHDGGYSYAHNLGRLAVEEMGIPTLVMENVPANAEAEQAIRNLIDQGCNVIYTNSFGHMVYTLKMAQEFPHLIFGHCSGVETEANMSRFFGKIYQARYLAGIAAGYRTASNRIGYVAAYPIPEVIRGINAFALGARSVNPDAVVEVMWTSTWFDPAVEKQAALELLDRGADVIAQHQDTTAAQIAAEERGAYAIGYNAPTPDAAPRAYLTAPLFHWEVFYTDDVQRILDGTWESRAFWEGLDMGMVSLDALTGLNDPRAAPAIESAMTRMIDGSFEPFTGPLAGQDDDERIPDGVRMSDDEIWNMNWFVQGVIGIIPPVRE